MKKLIIISTFAAFLLLGVSCGKKTTYEYYTCPMHPEIHENKPGNCPKCGMKLVLKKVTNKDTMQMDMPADTIPMDMTTGSKK